MLRHSRINNILYFAGEIYGLAILLFILASRISARLRDLALRIVRRPFPMSMVYFALLSTVTAVLEFPLSYYCGFFVSHHFGWLPPTTASLPPRLCRHSR